MNRDHFRQQISDLGLSVHLL